MMIVLWFKSDIKSLHLDCGGILALSVREDILEMEAAARQFEQEESMSQKVEKCCRTSEDFLLLSSIYLGVESDSYIPYCEISRETSQVPNHPFCDGYGSAGTQTSYCYYDSGFGSSSLMSTESPHYNTNVRFILV